MSRAKKNKMRGNQRGDVPDVPNPAQPLLLTKYSGRDNLAAGSIEQRVIKPFQPDGMLASWTGSTPPN